MKRVYIAGKYSDTNVLAILGNMRRGIELTLKALRAGFAPFCPWLDFQFGLHEDFPLETFYQYSLAYLECADAVLVVEQGWEDSKGTRAELARARELNIPVFFALDDLIAWNEFSLTGHPESCGNPSKQMDS